MKANRTYKHESLADQAEPQKKRIRSAFQIAALVYRWNKHRLEILLVTSRETRRWIVPKGWPLPGKSAAETAMREADEEAGVFGHASKKPVGRYSATKRIGEMMVPSEVEVYPLQFLKQKMKWKERSERTTQWLSPEDAAKTVAEPELAEIIRDFAEEMRHPIKVSHSA